MEGDADDSDHGEDSSELERIKALLDRMRAAESTDEARDVLEEIHVSATEGVPVGELVELLDELWSFFAQVALPPSGHRLHLDLTTSAWLGIAYRQAHAVAVLAKADLLDAAVANSRSAFEHAIYLSLIADARDYLAVLDVLEGKFHRTWREGLHGLEEPEAVILPYILAMEADLDAPREMAWVRFVEQVCDRLDTGDEVYRHYRLLSSLVHAGLGSTIPYLFGALDADGRPTMPRPILHETILAVAVGSCIWAGWSIDQLFGIRLFGPAVSKAAGRLNFTPLTRIKD